MARVYGQRLELLESMSRPDNDLGVEADGYKDGGIVGPGKVLDIVVVADEALVCLPVLDRRWFADA